MRIVGFETRTEAPKDGAEIIDLVQWRKAHGKPVIRRIEILAETPAGPRP